MGKKVLLNGGAGRGETGGGETGDGTRISTLPSLYLSYLLAHLYLS